jgi:hypothetical protein
VAHSQLRPHLACSTSDDGTARLLAGRGLAQGAGLLRLPAGGPICGAAFCPEDEHALALAGADACGYLFDLRKAAAPLQVPLRCSWSQSCSDLAAAVWFRCECAADAAPIWPDGRHT